MTHDEFVDWLSDEVRSERMTEPQMRDLLRQKSLFDEGRPTLGPSLDGLVVGYVAGHRIEAKGIHELFNEAKRDYPGKMVYFEPIGYTLF